MNDSFISQGKNFISSRRAAEISDYTIDYIGQLCRSAKLDCQMVGRTWFVSEESLLTHKLKVAEEEASPERVQNILKNRREQAVDVNELLAPSLNISPAYAGAAGAAGAVSTAVIAQAPSAGIFSLRNMVIAAIVFAVIGGSVVVLNSNLYQSVLAFIMPGRHLSVNLPPTIETSAVQNGIAVIPSTGSAAVDASEKTKIQNSFSDQVDVHADESGTAGVITPVFKATPSKAFMYVMVPVKDKKTATSTQ
jgi:hypothetical protein